MQAATTMSEGLHSQVATLRAMQMANGQGLDAGTAPFLEGVRRIGMRERRIAVGAER